MSIRLMTLVWDIPFPTQAQKLIALRLADYASDDGGSVFPARDTIAIKVGCGESTVKRTLRAFRDCGLLLLIREGGGRRTSTNEWLINVAMLKALAEGECRIDGSSEELTIEGEIPCAEPVDVGGAILTPVNGEGGPSGPQGGPRATRRGATSGPQLTNNHQLDSSGAGARASDASASRAPREVLPAAIVQIKRGDPSWTNWLDAVDVEVAERMEQAGAFDASSRWPKGKSDRVVIAGNNFTNRMLGERVE